MNMNSKTSIDNINYLRYMEQKEQQKVNADEKASSGEREPRKADNRK